MHHRRFSLDTPMMDRESQPTRSGTTPGAFVLCPLAALPGQSVEQRLWQQWLYQKAFAEAQAVVRPSLPERDLLAVWN